jgi:hypothetical protein
MVITVVAANTPGVPELSNLADWLSGEIKKVVPPKNSSAIRPLFPDIVHACPTVKFANFAASVALQLMTTFCPLKADADTCCVTVAILQSFH